MPSRVKTPGDAGLGKDVTPFLDKDRRDQTVNQRSVLVIVPCGKSKLWDREPHHGAVTAGEAYTGTPFRLNCQYAERFGDAWVVLSAKYGFIAPEFMIPESYEVSFKYPATSPIMFDRLRQQVRAAVGSLSGHCQSRG